MKSILAAITLSLLSGCTAGNVYYVDSRFSPEEERVIAEANDMWCTASPNALCMDLVFGARVDVGETERKAIVRAGDRAVYSRFPDAIERGLTGAFFHPARALENDLIVVLFERLAPQHLLVAVAHEMGHAHGIMTHSEDVRAIMYKNLTGAESKEALTCADLALVGLPCEKAEEPTEESRNENSSVDIGY